MKLTDAFGARNFRQPWVLVVITDGTLPEPSAFTTLIINYVIRVRGLGSFGRGRNIMFFGKSLAGRSFFSPPVFLLRCLPFVLTLVGVNPFHLSFLVYLQQGQTLRPKARKPLVYKGLRWRNWLRG